MNLSDIKEKLLHQHPKAFEVDVTMTFRLGKETDITVTYFDKDFKYLHGQGYTVKEFKEFICS